MNNFVERIQIDGRCFLYGTVKKNKKADRNMTTLKYKGLNCFVVLLRLIALALPIIGPAHSCILNHVMVSQFISGNTAKRYSISETLPASGCVIFNIQALDTTVTTSWLCTLAVSEISWRVSECARLLSSNSRNDQFSIFLFFYCCWKCSWW